MSRAFLTFLLALCLAAFVSAVEPGNTEKEVLATLGKPTITRQTTNGVIWKFKDGTSVRFEGGVVKEVDGPGAAKEVVHAATDAAASADAVAPAPTATKAAPAPAGASARPTSTPAPTTSNASAQPATTAPAKASPVGSAKLAPSAGERTPYRVPDPPAHSPVRRILGFVFLLLGLLAIGAGNIWLVVVAFKESVGWGIACFLIPVAALIFIITHWQATKKILGLQLVIGLPLVVLGAIVA